MLTLLLAILSIACVLTVVLPIVAVLRSARAVRDVELLRSRLAILEEQIRLTSAGPPRAEGTVTGPAILPRAADSHAPAPGAGQLARPSSEPPAPETAIAQSTSAPAAAAEPAPAETSGAGPVPDELPPADVRGAAIGSQQPQEQSGADWMEQAIGGRVLLYAGTIVLVLGIGYFLKYAFDRNWITETMRVVLGAAGGAALIAGGLRLATSGYVLYGQILAGGGLAALYLSIYAAFSFYGLLGSGVAFALLLGVTTLAAVLADRHRSQGLALIAVGFGFITPLLVGGGTDAQVTLFAYLAVLIGGTLYLSRRGGWPLPMLLAYVLTGFVVAAWAEEFYTRSKYLVTEGFLTLYCVLFVLCAREAGRLRTTDLGRVTHLALWTAPLVFHAASLGILAPHGVAFLVYSIAVSLTGVALAARHGGGSLARLAVWGLVALPLALWFETHQTRSWIVPGLVTIAAVFALHLVAQLERARRHDQTLDGPDLVLVHANGLGAFVGAWILLERQVLVLLPWVGTLLAFGHALIWRWLRSADPAAALQALAVAFTLVAAVLAIELDGPALTAALAAEGAAIVWIGLRIERGWFRLGGVALLAIAVARWLSLNVAPVPAGYRPLLNASFLLGAWIIALLYGVAWLHARQAGVRRHGDAIRTLLLAASALVVVLLTAENAAFWEVRRAALADATFAERMSLSLILAFYAGLLTIVGIWRQYPPVRYLAMLLFGLTILKVFFSDLSQLEGIYRVLGLIVVGAVLLVVSFLYQRGRGRNAAGGSPEPASTGQAPETAAPGLRNPEP